MFLFTCSSVPLLYSVSRRFVTLELAHRRRQTRKRERRLPCYANVLSVSTPLTCIHWIRRSFRSAISLLTVGRFSIKSSFSSATAIWSKVGFCWLPCGWLGFGPL